MRKNGKEVTTMTIDMLNGMGLSREECEVLLKRWDEREKEHATTVDKLRAELESPLRAAGLVPGEGRDGLPDPDGFLSGLNM
jgi:hypothetical protein